MRRKIRGVVGLEMRCGLVVGRSRLSRKEEVKVGSEEKVRAVK